MKTKGVGSSELKQTHLCARSQTGCQSSTVSVLQFPSSPHTPTSKMPKTPLSSQATSREAEMAMIVMGLLQTQHPPSPSTVSVRWCSPTDVPERRSNRLSKSLFILCRCKMVSPRRPLGLLSIWDGSSAWAKDSLQLCHPPNRVPVQGK